jgi:hypothetical protein
MRLKPTFDPEWHDGQARTRKDKKKYERAQKGTKGHERE